MRDSAGREVRYQSNGPLKSRAVPEPFRLKYDPNPMPAIALISERSEHLALIAIAFFAAGWVLTHAVLRHH